MRKRNNPVGVLIASVALLAACNMADGSEKTTTADKHNDKVGVRMSTRIVKSDNEWKELLTPEQYMITRQGGTERPFSGKYNEWKKRGMFKCVCCGHPLFDSEHKFDSGTGWPSFWTPATDSSLVELEDRAFGIRRVEVRCSRCDAHLGHVFSDGPAPTGLRYCINSASLEYEPREED